MGDVNSAYKKAGVDYSSIDPIKILAQKMAAGTAKNLTNRGLKELAASRGESAYVWEENDSYGAFVIEGLGTKNLIADDMRAVTGKTYYDQIAQDTVAMIVNDLIVVGAMPKVINAYFAVGDFRWMNDEERAMNLINGWAAACNLAGATWGGGETPTLKDIVVSTAIELAGAAVGEINPKSNLILGDKLVSGDAVLLIESSGIHANGITLVRHAAAKNPDLYSAKLDDGRLFGEALLSPTHIYVNLVKSLLEEGLNVHYMVNITGHGWRKLMRANQDFSYILENLPPVASEFKLIQRLTGASENEMYGTFNMGAGFAVYLPQADAKAAQEIAQKNGFKSWIAGQVEQGPKQVIIKPKNIAFAADSLEIR